MSVVFFSYKKIFLISILTITSAVYAGQYYKVVLGVYPGCDSGAIMTTSVWAEGSFAACDIAKRNETTFKYCCSVSPG